LASGHTGLAVLNSDGRVNSGKKKAKDKGIASGAQLRGGRIENSPQKRGQNRKHMTRNWALNVFR